MSGGRLGEQTYTADVVWPRVHGMRSLMLGTPGPLRTRLNRLVLSGTKVATSSLLSEYDREGEDLEHIGEPLALVDDTDKYVATVEVTAVDVCRFDEVALPHAVAEGEGSESIEDWRGDHRDYWKSEGVEIDDSTQVVCLTFRLVLNE